MKEIQWCWLNSIYIYPVPVDNSKGVRRPRCYIFVNNQGKEHKIDYIYTQNAQLYDEITRMYKEIYNKNHERI